MNIAKKYISLLLLFIFIGVLFFKLDGGHNKLTLQEVNGTWHCSSTVVVRNWTIETLQTRIINSDDFSSILSAEIILSDPKQPNKKSFIYIKTKQVFTFNDSIIQPKSLEVMELTKGVDEFNIVSPQLLNYFEMSIHSKNGPIKVIKLKTINNIMMVGADENAPTTCQRSVEG